MFINNKMKRLVISCMSIMAVCSITAGAASVDTKAKIDDVTAQMKTYQSYMNYAHSHAEAVRSTGAEYCILGHSERRAYYHEDYAILREKTQLALANGLKVIFCIGEVKEEREAGKQNEVVKAQLEGSVFNLTAEEWKNVVLAYEPVWAIGTGLTATPEQAQEIHAYIRGLVAQRYGQEVADATTILYGGSCNEKNAAELFACPDIDGGLIGGAALVAEKFLAIIAAR